MTCVRYRYVYELTNDTPYIALTGELQGAYLMLTWEKMTVLNFIGLCCDGIQPYNPSSIHTGQYSVNRGLN